MYFFIDESWQSTKNGKFKVGVLSAVPFLVNGFNDFLTDIYRLKCKHLGHLNGDQEIKGKDVFRNYHFRSELKGKPSYYLELARDVFKHLESKEIPVFASVTFEKDEIDLSCAKPRQLDRPFFFLFERINQYMKEKFPATKAVLVFDDRDVGTNKNISKAISNFLNKSYAGRNFDHITKVPFFAISAENSGIQTADLIAHVVGRRFTGDRGAINEFFQIAKKIAYKSQPISIGHGPNLKTVILGGIKIAKERREKVREEKGEAGVLEGQA